MKSKHPLLGTLAFFAVTTANAGESAAPPQEGKFAAATSSTARWADRCTNFTTNGWAFKAPRNFLQWLDVFTDPAIYLEFARRGMDPRSYVASLSSLLDPGTPRNHLEWTNPGIYTEWARTAFEPEYYTAVNSILFDPARIMRWAMLPTDARVWDLAATALSPATWTQWLTAPSAPETQALFDKAADPDTLRQWSEAFADPKNYEAFNAWWSASATGAYPPPEAGTAPR